MDPHGRQDQARGREAAGEGASLTAAACFMRASRYYQTGERFIHPRSQHSMEVYAKSVKIFGDAAAIIRRPRIEPVEVPYEGSSLPALLVHPDPRRRIGRRPAWCSSTASTSPRSAIRLRRPGPRRARHRLPDRRRAGNGESVRFRNLPLIAETERYATPVYEYLAGRPEFDPERIGVMALSLGGYYAPRAARSSRASPVASPGARSGTTTPSGRSGSTSSPPARCCRSRCRPSICNGCSA